MSERVPVSTEPVHPDVAKLIANQEAGANNELQKARNEVRQAIQARDSAQVRLDMAESRLRALQDLMDLLGIARR